MANKKIMIIEDDRAFALALGLRLRINDYDVVTAEDAATAQTSVLREKPDLIILDLGLPGGDGFMVLNRLKSNLHSAPIPVIVLTGRDRQFEERAHQAGAIAFFQKPAANEALLATIENTLRDTGWPL